MVSRLWLKTEGVGVNFVIRNSEHRQEFALDNSILFFAIASAIKIRDESNTL